MRKILNKNGFSLAELLVVVVLMGVLLCFAIPTYRSSQIKSENKACATNIEMIQLAVVEYYTAQQTEPDSLDDLAPFLDDGVLPVCPKSNDEYVYNYGVAAQKNADNTWTGIVVCACDEEEHTPDGEADALPADGDGCNVLQEASTTEK